MSQSPPSPPSAESNALSGDRKGLDDALSQRFIALDPAGYFLIKVDAQRQELVAEHYANTINDRGLATDPETGEVIRCQGAEPRKPLSIYRGRTAKELGILLTEGEGPFPITSLDHALDLGRELQKAEQCLNAGQVYIQD